MVTADLDVTVGLGRALLAEQHPDLLERGGLSVAAHGWDNVMLRLGEHLALRLPRRAAAAHLVEHEQRALPALAARLAPTGVAVPAPVRVGRPSAALGYPWAWSVVPWLDGVAAEATPVAARTAWAPALGAFLAALHVPDGAAGAPANPFRGVALAERPEARDPHRLAERLAAVPARWRAGALRAWRTALAAPPHAGPPVWLHGDPHPANLVVAPGGRGTAGGAPDRLVAAVDFGDVTAGDPASDLGGLWLAFDAAGRARCRAVVDARADGGRGWDAATWARAGGWAALYAASMVAHPDEHPRLVPIGEHALRELAAEA
ncbi:phosphotransferase [Puerhibacterium sp. TATVAM-FAB25]|uniref:phosphotransferase n=1 Tax=Puerhibacterium sp. TATVAM-FAB25 TaxID=3093699 RepID=UPI00397B87AA